MLREPVGQLAALNPASRKTLLVAYRGCDLEISEGEDDLHRGVATSGIGDMSGYNTISLASTRCRA